MAAKPFASSADLAAKEQTLEVLADGVYALTAEGDPNVGAVEGRGLPRLLRGDGHPRRRAALARPPARAHRQAGALPGAVALPRRAGAGRQRVRRRRDRHAREDPRADRRAREAGLGVGVRPHAAPGRAGRLGARPHLAHAHVLRPPHDRPRRRPRRPRAAVLRARAHRRRHRRLAAAAEGALRGRPRGGRGRALHRRRLPPRVGVVHLGRHRRDRRRGADRRARRA